MSIAGAELPEPMAGSRVAAEIRAELARRDITQKDLARMCFQSQPWVSRRLSGIVPMTLNDAEVMASGLGLTIVDLIYRAYPPRTPGGQPTVAKVAGDEPTPPRRLVSVPTSRSPVRPMARRSHQRPLLQLVSA